MHISEHIIYVKRFSQRRRFWLLGIQHCGQSRYHKCTPVHSWRNFSMVGSAHQWKNIQTPAVGGGHHSTSTTAAKYMLNLIVRRAFS